jgi:hypothetical protein
VYSAAVVAGGVNLERAAVDIDAAVAADSLALFAAGGNIERAVFDFEAGTGGALEEDSRGPVFGGGNIECAAVDLHATGIHTYPACVAVSAGPAVERDAVSYGQRAIDCEVIPVR